MTTTEVANEFVITRVFNAPKKLVWKALSEAEALAQWWGPIGATIHISKLVFKPNGVFHYNMQSPMGVMWGLFKYLEMVEPEKLVFISSFSDEAGGITPNPFLPAFPLEIKNIITLEEQNGKTTLTLKGGPINATEEQNKAYRDMMGSMNQGFAGTFDQLDEYLSKASK